MTATYQQYQEILHRVPHIDRAEIVDDPKVGVRVHVVSHSRQSPRHLVREIVSLLRSSGWHDIHADNVVIVQIQQDIETGSALGRLRIAGFSLTYGSSGYEAQCRLSHGNHIYAGHHIGFEGANAVAEATLCAVNEALGDKNGLRLIEAKQLTIAGVDLCLVLVIDGEGEVLLGNAVRRDATPEESMIRAVLDAVNRRFVLYTGQKI